MTERQIRDAHETHDGFVEAAVDYDDGHTQTVRVPSWATKEQILIEADRERAKLEAQVAARQRRVDLLSEDAVARLPVNEEGKEV